MKTRYLAVASVIIIVLLFASQAFLPMGNHQVNPAGDRAYWTELAENAWEYFQPGKGVNPTTGLHSAGLYWPYFTEWDLGTYIQAIIDARELGILQKDGQWGFDYRIETILNFLKTRKLTSDGVPYLNYDSRTGAPYGGTPSFSIDEGKLYMALYNLKVLRPDLAQNITQIVNRNNNSALMGDPTSWLGSTDFYAYYVASAFKGFGFAGWDAVPSSILSTIVSQPNVTAYGVKLPTAHICTEPLLLTFFEINPQDPKFAWLLSQVYLASEARYTATGHYTAFSEGNTGLDNPGYVYEFVVDSDGSTFKVAPPTTPIAYFKVAVAFHAIFNTEYTQNMVNYIKGKLPVPAEGFQDGVAEDGRIVNTIIDRTNGLIISAARYAIENIPIPSPSSSPTPTVTPTPIPSSSPSFSPSPTPSVSSLSPTPSTSSSPSSSPTPTTSPRVGWTIEPIVIVLLAVVGCLSLFLLLMIRLKRNDSTKFAKQH